MTLLSDEDIKHLEKLSVKDSVVATLYSEYKRFTIDESHLLKEQFVEIGKVIADDLKAIRNKTPEDCVLLTNDKDDKQIDRVLKIIEKGEILLSVMRGGTVQVEDKQKAVKKADKGIPEL